MCILKPGHVPGSRIAKFEDPQVSRFPSHLEPTAASWSAFGAGPGVVAQASHPDGVNGTVAAYGNPGTMESRMVDTHILGCDERTRIDENLRAGSAG